MQKDLASLAKKMNTLSQEAFRHFPNWSGLTFAFFLAQLLRDFPI